MAGSISNRHFYRPRHLKEALRLLNNEPSLLPLAGCTDVYVALNFGTLEAIRFLDLWGLDELRGISRTTSGVRIGALTTYTDLIRSPVVQRTLPMLAAASREVGGVQIQNRGTIGGNVANASPAGDTLPVLAAAGATLELQSTRGTRQVPFSSFFTGYKQTVSRPDELIVAVEVPAIRAPQWFRKVGTRAAQAISKVVFAGVAGPSPTIGIGSVGPTVIRPEKTERALAAGASVADAQAVLLAEISPIDDLRSTAEYRRRVAANLLAEFLSATRRPRAGSRL